MYKFTFYQKEAIKQAVFVGVFIISVNVTSYSQTVPQDFLQKGDNLYKQKKYNEAITHYDKMLEIIPSQIQALTNRGICKIRTKDTSGIEELNQAILLDPANFETYYNRGLGKVWIRDDVGAIKDFEKAISLNPEFGEAYYNIGLIKFRLGDRLTACSYWKQSASKGYKRAQGITDIYCNIYNLK